MTTKTPTPAETEGVFARIKKAAARIGRPLVEKALYLYFALKNPKTPAWAKRVIYGALAYLVLPVDAIPDLLPGVGFTDDLSVITAALATVSLYINADVKAQAQEKVKKWFDTDKPSITDVK